MLQAIELFCLSETEWMIQAMNDSKIRLRSDMDRLSEG